MRKIELPPELRDKIVASKSAYEKAAADNAQARAAAEKEIASLEAAAREINARIATLTREAVDSDTAAGELSGCERRAAAIAGQLEKTKSARAAVPQVNLDEINHALDAIVGHWPDAIKEAILADLAPYGYPSHLVLPLMAHSEALQVLRIIRDRHYLGGYGPDTIFEYFNRALAGNVNLNSPVQAAADSAKSSQQ